MALRVATGGTGFQFSGTIKPCARFRVRRSPSPLFEHIVIAIIATFWGDNRNIILLIWKLWPLDTRCYVFNIVNAIYAIIAAILWPSGHRENSDIPLKSAAAMVEHAARSFRARAGPMSQRHGPARTLFAR